MLTSSIVFVDSQLKQTSRGLLRSNRLQALLDRWEFSNRNEEHQPDDADLFDDLNPKSNPRRRERGPIRDRIDDAKTRFAWWILATWLGVATGSVAIILPWLFLLRRFRWIATDHRAETYTQNRPARVKKHPKRRKSLPRCWLRTPTAVKEVNFCCPARYRPISLMCNTNIAVGLRCWRPSGHRTLDPDYNEAPVFRGGCFFHTKTHVGLRKTV